MRGKCAAITRKGQPCKGLVRTGNDYCPAHDPARQKARSRAASKAGKSKPGQEIRSLKKQLKELTEDVLSGKRDKGIATVANLLLNTQLRALEIERKIREQEELEVRVRALEEAQKAQRGGGRWGA